MYIKRARTKKIIPLSPASLETQRSQGAQTNIFLFPFGPILFSSRRSLRPLLETIVFCFFLFFVFLIPSSTAAGEGRWEEPWPKQGAAKAGAQEVAASSPGAGQRAVQGAIRFFQGYISPVDGDRCPCYPTCSQYAIEAVKKHGALIGLVMTFDRLIHETDEIRQVPLMKIHGSYRYFDPVENNDFWWAKK
jgi:putative membrane protein insertion efficiency factor